MTESTAQTTPDVAREVLTRLIHKHVRWASRSEMDGIIRDLAAAGITLTGPDQVAVSGEAVTELIEFIDEHDPDDDRMTRSIWDALAELRAAFGAGPDASETGGQQ